MLTVCLPGCACAYPDAILTAMQASMADRALWFAFSAGLALLMGWRGLRKGSLSKSGAAAAVLVGTMHMWAGLPWGMTLIAFYLSGSKLTRMGDQRKSQLDEGHTPGGRRTAVQVLSNSLGGCIATAVYTLLATQHHDLLQSVAEDCIQAGRQGDSCVLVPEAREQAVRLQRGMVLCAAAFLGHYSCCSADTWASELGILARTAPRLILPPWRKVPPGTNGGVTGLGLIASLGGAVVVFIAWLLSTVVVGYWVTPQAYTAVLQNVPHTSTAGALTGIIPASTLQAGPLSTLQPHTLLTICALCCMSGLLGSLLDSLLGAALQFSGWHEARRKVVSRPGPGVKRISGVDRLSNDAVNALAAGLTSLVAALVAQRW